MESKPFTSKATALREKKINMTLDDIIKMSKKNAAKPNRQRDMDKRSRNFSGNQDKTQKMQHYMNSRSTLRQDFFAQKRLGFQGNSFPLAFESARKTTVIPFCGRAVNHKNNNNCSQSEFYFRRVSENLDVAALPLRRLVVPSDPQLFLRKSRPSGPLRKQGNVSNVSNTPKAPERREALSKLNLKTLDSRFSNLKEQRMRVFTPTYKAGGFGVRQPWLRK